MPKSLTAHLRVSEYTDRYLDNITIAFVPGISWEAEHVNHQLAIKVAYS